MRRRLIWLSFIIFFACSGASLAEARVEQVAVEIVFPPGYSLYPDLVERINLSFKSVAEKVLVGQRVSAVNLLENTFTATIETVFRNVLRGFRIEKLELYPGEKTLMRVYLRPEAPLIEKATLIIAPVALAPELLQFLENNEPLFGQVATEVLEGVPVAALDWAEGVMLIVLEQVVATQLPGFDVRLNLKVGVTTQITLYLTPKGPTVRQAHGVITSSTLPATVTQLLSAEVEKQASLLVGMPIAFLSHYQEQIETNVTSQINQEPRMKKWGLVSDFQLEPGEVTIAQLHVDSRFVRLGLGFSLNIGPQAPSPALNTHCGFLLGKQEFFIENQLALTSLEGNWYLGTGWQIAPRTEVTAMLELAPKKIRFRFAHCFNQYHLGIESDFQQGLMELSLGTTAQNLSIELVGDLERNYWLRLTAQI